MLPCPPTHQHTRAMFPSGTEMPTMPVQNVRVSRVKQAYLTHLLHLSFIFEYLPAMPVPLISGPTLYPGGQFTNKVAGFGGS